MERLTIDEVIAHCERKVERIEKLNEVEALEVAYIDIPPVREYWEHKQVKQWLEELKEYREKDDCGRDYVKRTGKCPICTDCPHNCPLDKE